MPIVKIHDEIYTKVKKICTEKYIEYPTIMNFINKATKKLIDEEDD